MKLVVTYRESPMTRFTYTPTECRLKIGTEIAESHVDLVMEFAHKLCERLEADKYPFSLRAPVKVHFSTNGHLAMRMNLKCGSKGVFNAGYGEVARELGFSVYHEEEKNG